MPLTCGLCAADMLAAALPNLPTSAYSGPHMASGAWNLATSGQRRAKVRTQLGKVWPIWAALCCKFAGQTLLRVDVCKIVCVKMHAIQF